MHFLAANSTTPDNRLPLYRFDTVSFTYPDGRTALDELSLTIFQGDRIALLGQNGSGKTTLVKHLNGLLASSAGTILYKGEGLDTQLIRAIRLETGVLFQDPDDHLFCSTLYEDIAFGPMNQGLPEALVEQRVRKVAQEAGLEKFLFKPAHHLSYGQKKRAAFAAVMAMEPSVLILDEPSANLDPKQEQMLKEQLAHYPGTLICIDHDLLFLYGVCERAVVLSKGKVHHDYGFNDLLSHKKSLRDHGLDFTFRFSCCGGHAHHGDTHHGHEHDTKTISTQMVRTPTIVDEPAPMLIQVSDYSYRYPDGTVGLSSVGLEIGRGERLALIGENGAGKSTLASVLLGLMTGYGRYWYKGELVTPKSRRQLWKSVGMVFQDSSDQLFCPSCQEEIAFGPRQIGCSAAEIDQRVKETLGLMRLAGYEERVPLNMSGGERKRLAIGAALSMQPDVLILDEPSAGLDPQGEEILLDVLRGIPMTMIVVTHDQYFLRELTDRTIVMHQGMVVRDYSTKEFLHDSHLETVNQLDYTYQNACCQDIMALQKGKQQDQVT